MKLFTSIAIIAVLSGLAQLFLPWWSIALVAFLVCFWRSTSAGQAMAVGSLGIALVWQFYALLIHVQNTGILTGRMSQLLFKADMPIVLLQLTVFIGGLVGGLAALSGYLFRQAVLPKTA